MRGRKRGPWVERQGQGGMGALPLGGGDSSKGVVGTGVRSGDGVLPYGKQFMGEWRRESMLRHATPHHATSAVDGDKRLPGTHLN